MRSLSTGSLFAGTGMLMLAGTICGCGGETNSAVALASRTLASATVADQGQAAAGAAEAAPAAAVPAGEAEGSMAGGGAHAAQDIYGIINLAPPPVFRGFINARGQAAFEYTALDDHLHVGFFNGERVIDISPPRNDASTLGAVNDRGEVAFQARLGDPGNPVATPFQPYRWSAARGLVALRPFTAAADTFTNAINNRGEIVGASAIAPVEGSFRAIRWTAANRQLPLPSPPGIGEAGAGDINESNVSVGSGNDGSGASHVIVWDAAGRPTDLGTLGANTAFALYNNNRGDIAGMLDLTGPVAQAFLWSPGKGVVRVGPNTIAGRLNQLGELVGRIQREGDANHAYLFSRARGLVDLHIPAFYATEAADVNDSSVVVGLARPRADSGTLAYRWSRTGAAVDLNTRLRNPPSGLVLSAAIGIGANGDILANSNAGLLLLRRGGGGTDAPVLGPIQLAQPVLNQPIRLTLSFRDRNPHDTHTATVDWGDGGGPQRAVVRESHGKGEVRAEHTYTTTGDFNVVVRVTDSTRRTTLLNQRISISPPAP